MGEKKSSFLKSKRIKKALVENINKFEFLLLLQFSEATENHVLLCISFILPCVQLKQKFILPDPDDSTKAFLNP